VSADGGGQAEKSGNVSGGLHGEMIGMVKSQANLV
jgi:hypothetical protein